MMDEYMVVLRHPESVSNAWPDEMYIAMGIEASNSGQATLRAQKEAYRTAKRDMMSDFPQTLSYDDWKMLLVLPADTEIIDRGDF
jgi:hypothetical protein